MQPMPPNDPVRLQQQDISPRVRDNTDSLRHLFIHNSSFVVRSPEANGRNDSWAAAYLSALIDEKLLNSRIIRKLEEDGSSMTPLQSLSSLSDLKPLNNRKEAADFILNAGCIFFVDGKTCAYGIHLPGYKTRSVEEPQTEPVVRGPREGLIEDIQVNLSMIFRRLKSTELKAVDYRIGRNSQTQVTAMYMNHLVHPEVLTELNRRIGQIDIDILIESAQLEELIQDRLFSPFPQLFHSERPDRIVSALNDGRIAVMVDGSPSALIVPTVFTDFLQASEDYYERFMFSNFIRVLRMIALMISLLGPSLYIALTTFHQEMLPSPLLLTFIATKAGVPFPTFIEALIMEVAFELLREAGVRLPRTVGQAVSIVGALIIGEAAVQSGIVSRPMVIVVAATGIASFAIPAFNAAIAFRMLRFPFMFVAASVGVFGLAICSLLLLLHVCSLRSFGVPFLSPIAPVHWRNWLGDVFVLPSPLRKFRPEYIQRRNKRKIDVAALNHDKDSSEP